jgi:hypothetical protein
MVSSDRDNVMVMADQDSVLTYLKNLITEDVDDAWFWVLTTGQSTSPKLALPRHRR